MEHKMHKASRQLSDAETLEILKKGDHGTLSVQGDDGYPYSTPVNYIMVANKLYIHSAPYGYKIECLERNTKCCFSAIISAKIIPSKITAAFESVIMTGNAVFIEDQAEKRAALEAFVTQKHPGYEDVGFKMIDKQIDKTAVMRIDPISMTGKAYHG
ncbi:MAG: pyridoxamine 5'-phosphate oxidase family protein [Clostridiales bacterium]|nr:pyridoxamine 5'-phosphate oxidase family protein [Clostridiales bacterium]MDY4172332.1 pyridoxamine 5'-phosphate oxidase family protein [Evtepia sp.]